MRSMSLGKKNKLDVHKQQSERILRALTLIPDIPEF